MSQESKSYSQILRSSSIMGGAQGLNYLVSLVRVKIVATLLGPTGVGLVSLYTSVTGLMGTVSGLGLGSSGVREVAQAFNDHDQTTLAYTVMILRRACWVAGLIGWGLTILLAAPLSTWVCGSTVHATAIGLLGVTLLLASVNNGQTALLQGMRRIGDIARANVVTMLFNTGVAIGLYAWLGLNGIVPVLIVTSILTLVITGWFVRRVSVKSVTLSWSDAVIGTRRLAGLGVAFMWSGLLTAGLDIITRSLITRLQGIDAAGLYQAAWALSGLFAGFILSAMGTDFYPRLTSVIHDHNLASQTVNEQIEIGVLLALPGLLGTLAFAPWLMMIFYSKQFLAAADLLPWFVLGIFGKIISWPLGFILLAKGASRWFAISETVMFCFRFGLLLFAIPHYGLSGVAYTFAISYFVYTITMLPLVRRLIGFRCSENVKKLMVKIATVLLIGVGARLAFSNSIGMAIGGVVTLVGTALTLRGLAIRLGAGNRLTKWACKVPGGRRLLGV